MANELATTNITKAQHYNDDFEEKSSEVESASRKKRGLKILSVKV